jgi:hypothetical protein
MGKEPDKFHKFHEFEDVTFRKYSSGEDTVSIGVRIPIKSVFKTLGESAVELFAFFGGSRMEVVLSATPAGCEKDRPGQTVMEAVAPDFELTSVADVSSFRGNRTHIGFTLSCADSELGRGDLERFKFHSGRLEARRLGDRPRKRTTAAADREETHIPDTEPAQQVFPLTKPRRTSRRGRTARDRA